MNRLLSLKNYINNIYLLLFICNCIILKKTNKYIIVLNTNNLYYVTLHLRYATPLVARLTAIFGIDVLNAKKNIIYVYTLKTTHVLFLSILTKKTINTIATVYINAGWYERELIEFFGLNIYANKDGRHLLLPYNFKAKPLLKSIRYAKIFSSCNNINRGEIHY